MHGRIISSVNRPASLWFRNGQILLALASAWYCGWSLPGKVEGDFSWPAASLLGAVAISAGVAASRPVGSKKGGGCVLWFLVAMFWSTAWIIKPVFESARAAASHVNCVSNIKRLGLAQIIYSIDFDDRYPSADRWRTLLSSQGYLKSTDGDSNASLRCRDSSFPFTYGMNAGLSKRRADEIASPADTVLLFECDSNSPDAKGGKEQFAPRHYGRGSLAWGDGRAKLVRPDQSKLWTP